jgi:hypothetical protein
MSSAIADGVMAATHKLVQQAMQGHWHDVPKTLEQRRALLDQLTSTASPQDRPWLDALKQAMAESDAAVAKIAATEAPSGSVSQQALPADTSTATPANAIDNTLEMIRGTR